MPFRDIEKPDVAHNDETMGHSRECDRLARSYAMYREDGDDEMMRRTSRRLEEARKTCPACRLD